MKTQARSRQFERLEGRWVLTGPVDFSRDSGTFVDPFLLTLTSPDPTAAIYYTTNGTTPTDSSTRYTSPIPIANTTQVRAISSVPDQPSSAIVSAHYIALDNTVADFSSNLPIVVLESYNQSIPGYTSLSRTQVSAVVIDTQLDGRALATGTPDYAGYGSLRIGNDDDAPNSAFAKVPYDFQTRTDGGGENPAPLLGMPGDWEWFLYNPHTEKSLLQNALAYQWSNEMGRYAPRTRFVEVFRNLDGDAKINYADDYVGVYILMEKIKVAPDRVEIEPLQPGDGTGLEVTGGYIWKKSRLETSQFRWFNTAAGIAGPGRAGPTLLPTQTLQIYEPDASEVTAAQTSYLTNHVNAFTTALDGPEFTDPVTGYRNYIDIDSWIDYWLLVELTKNVDGYRLGAYWHKDRDSIDPETQEVILGKIKAEPAWDFNLALGNANYLRGGHPDGWYADMLNNTDYPYWRRLFQDPYFKQKLTDRWQELRRTVFTTEKVLADVDAYVELLGCNHAGSAIRTGASTGNCRENRSDCRTNASFPAKLPSSNRRKSRNCPVPRATGAIAPSCCRMGIRAMKVRFRVNLPIRSRVTKTRTIFWACTIGPTVTIRSNRGTARRRPGRPEGRRFIRRRRLTRIT